MPNYLKCDYQRMHSGTILAITVIFKDNCMTMAAQFKVSVISV